MIRFFNTTGPCNPQHHFMLPPEGRMPGLLRLVEQEQYFVVHAARQTGKTTAMRAFAARLRDLGYVALWATLEESQGVADPAMAEPLWLASLSRTAGYHLPAAQRPPAYSEFLASPVGQRLHDWLRAWCAALPTSPIVLLLDEADTVTGAAMVSLLRQLRAGFMDRAPGCFPVSIALIGMRDLRDYLMEARDGVPLSPGSPFNIKRASITLRNFDTTEVRDLLLQHTTETGQAWGEGAIERVNYWSAGQPFLTNALAQECTEELVLDRSQTITAAHVDDAKERLILARTTHLHSLSERLKEPRVARIVQAVLAGDTPLDVPYESDDFQYVVDMGLIRRGPDGAEASNPIYREILVRQLSYNTQESLPRPWWPWALPDGRLDFPALLDAFFGWWRENADELLSLRTPYPEIVPHLALMAFVQRVVNGGGRVTREFAAGRGAIDLLIEYGPERFVLEIKRVRDRDSLESVREKGAAQLSRYLDTVGLAEGWLVIFDPRPGRTWADRLWQEDLERDGKVLRLRGG